MPMRHLNAELTRATMWWCLVGAGVFLAAFLAGLARKPRKAAAAPSGTGAAYLRDVTWFPEETLVRPPIADPRGPYTQGLVQSYSADRKVQDDLFDGVVAEGDIGFDYPLLGGTGYYSGDYQVSFEGGVYSNFLGEGDNAQDLVSIDYRVGLTLEGDFTREELRLTVYHESSHLGDEFVEETGRSRNDWSREALRGVYFREFNDRWKLYGGGEYTFRRQMDTIDDATLIAGAQRRILSHYYGAADARFRQYADYEPLVTLQLGRHFFRGNVTVAVQYQDGPLPNGQFFRQEREAVGILVRLNGPNIPEGIPSRTEGPSKQR